MAPSSSGLVGLGDGGTTAATQDAPATSSALRWSRVVFLSLLFSLAQVFQELIGEVTFTRQTAGPSTAETATMYALFQVVGTTLTARVMLSVQARAKGAPASANQRPSWPLVVSLAMLVFASTALANWALDYVFYPAKVVAKSAKLVPTMIVAVMMGNSAKFTAVDYLGALLLCAGAAGFALASGKTLAEAVANEADDGLPIPDVPDALSLVSPVASRAWLGLVMLTMATTADALVPNLQQRTMREGVGAEQLAFSVNAFGALAIATAIVLTGGVEVWTDVWAADMTTFYLMVLGGACTGVGVMCYTFLIVEAGSVVAVVVSTMRKVVTILLSFVLLPSAGKAFSGVHAVSTVLVVAGMGIRPAVDCVWPRKPRGSASDAAAEAAPASGHERRGAGRADLSGGGGGGGDPESEARRARNADEKPGDDVEEGRGRERDARGGGDPETRLLAGARQGGGAR